MLIFYLLVSGMPLVNQPLLTRFVEQLTLVKYLGLASLLYALLHVAMKRSLPSAWRSSLAILLALFYGWTAFSYLTRSLPEPWQLSPFLSLTSFVLLFFIVLAVVDTEARLRWTLYVAIGSVALGSVYVVREWEKYHEVYENFRPGWVVGDANYFTLSALLCLPLAYFMLQERRPWWERLFLAGSILITLLAVTLCASRGGFLGLLLVCGFAVWRSRHRARNFLLICTLLAPLLALAPASSLDRLLHPDYSDIAAEQDRLVVWRAGLHMIAAHPWLGIGFGNFKPMVLQFEESGPQVQTLAHNTYIGTAAELGLPGLALLLFLLVSAYRLAGLAYRRTAFEMCVVRQAALGVQAGLLGCAIGICFLSAITQKLLWLMLFLTPCLAHLAWQRESSLQAAALAAAGEASPWSNLGAQPRELAAGGSLAACARDLAEIFR